MSPSEFPERRSERVCIRGCTERGSHTEHCAWFGIRPDLTPSVAALPNAPAQCKGCSPSPARSGALICDRCYRRADSLLRDAPDIIGRIRSKTDQGSATVWVPVKATSSSSESPVQVDSDELDAVTEIMRNLRDWANALDASSLPHADRAGLAGDAAFRALSMDVTAIRQHLPRIANDTHLIKTLAEAVLVHHTPDDDGYRAWSIADAAARWGVERRDRQRFVYPVEDEGAEGTAYPVREWYDPLITLEQAADRAGLTQRALRKWVEKDVLEVAARVRGPRGSVLTYVYASKVDEARVLMEGRRHPGRRGRGDLDTPELTSMLE